MKLNIFFICMILISFSCRNNQNNDSINLVFNILNGKHTASCEPKYQLLFYKNTKLIAERIFYNGRTFHSKGKIPDAIIHEYYDNGKIRNMYNFKNGVRHGKAISFYPSGRLKGIAEYNKDNPVGISTFYYENGNVLSESNIVDGAIISYKEYYKTGNLKEEILIENKNKFQIIYNKSGDILHKRRIYSE